MNTNEIMHFSSRYHQADCAPLNDHEVMIRIRTGMDIRRVEVVYNDPYIRIPTAEGLYWPYNIKEMEKTGEAFDHCFYTAVLPCQTHRLKYYFLIYGDDECLQYSESGFTKNFRHEDLATFFVPYISDDMIFHGPEWVENVIWYQIFPTRFNRNIKGIIEKLPYLKALGVNGLYINPVYQAHSYHKYDVINYKKVDSDLGTKQDFRTLCRQARRLGMKIMLDISVTHCSDANPMFQDVVEHHQKSPYFPMFKVSYKNKKLSYECFGTIRSMPKFETENEMTVAYFDEVINFWMSLGVDAWRLDVADEISDTMLKAIRKIVKKKKKDTYIVGEIWHNATEWISSRALDGVTNYAFSRAVLRFVCDPSHDIYLFRSMIDELLHSYTFSQIKSCMPLLDSHDTPRLRTICDDDPRKFKLALLLLHTFYGTPSIYYGTERYMEGVGDPDNRRPTNWDDHSEIMEDIFEMTQLFIRLRREHPVLANEGSYEWIDHPDFLLIRRKNSKENFLIIINSREYFVEGYLPDSFCYINLIDECHIHNKISMMPLGFMVLKQL